jgi:hypothetical protein
LSNLLLIINPRVWKERSCYTAIAIKKR